MSNLFKLEKSFVLPSHLCNRRIEIWSARLRHVGQLALQMCLNLENNSLQGDGIKIVLFERMRNEERTNPAERRRPDCYASIRYSLGFLPLNCALAILNIGPVQRRPFRIVRGNILLAQQNRLLFKRAK